MANPRTSFPLSHITYRRHASITDRFSSLIHLNDGKNQDCTDLGPGLVQLWSETVNSPQAVCFPHSSLFRLAKLFVQQQPAEKDKILSAHQSSSHTAMLAAQTSSSHNSTFAAPKESSREARRQPHQQPGYREVPPRRMVIFIHKTRKILTIPSMSIYLCYNDFTTNELKWAGIGVTLSKMMASPISFNSPL